jgi:hypothetical protein
VWAACEKSRPHEQGRCESYLAEYRNGVFSKQAAERVDRAKDIQFQRAMASKTVEALRVWLNSWAYYSSAREQVPLVRRAFENALYEATKAGPSLELFEEYMSSILDGYCDGRHVATLKALMEPRVFAKVKMDNRIENFEKFLTDYPNSGHANECRALLDPILFAQASKDDFRSDYEHYLKELPNGRYIVQANRRIASLRG